MTTSKTPKSRKRDLDEILSRYADILNMDGVASARDQAYLKTYAADEHVLRLLHGARAVKALFEAFGEFPDLGCHGRWSHLFLCIQDFCDRSRFSP